MAKINIYHLRVGFISHYECIPRELPLWKELRVQIWYNEVSLKDYGSKPQYIE